MNPDWIKGKTVRAVEMRYYDGRDGKACDPVIHFTDSTSIYFYTQETDGREYGIGIVYVDGIEKKMI